MTRSLGGLPEARAVKEKLSEILRLVPGVNGVGVARRLGRWAVKVNVLESDPDFELPDRIDGIEIFVEIIGQVDAQ